MKKFQAMIGMGLMLLCVTSFAQTKDDTKIMNDADQAKGTLLKADPALQNFFDNSAGYVIFPNVGKGGFIIGGASGNGVLYDGGIAVGMADLKKVNVGLQVGGQKVIEVIFFEGDEQLEEFKAGEYEFSAEASAVALKSGVAANAKYKEGVAAFILPKGGLMADASIGGQKFNFKPFAQ